MWPCQRMETLDLNFWCTRFSDSIAGRNPICREGLGGAVTDFSFLKLKRKGLAWPGGTFSLSLEQEKSVRGPWPQEPHAVGSALRPASWCLRKSLLVFR